MEYERSVISEGRLSTLTVLACVPVILVLLVILNGGTLENSMYTRSLGPIVYVIFYAGMLYATYEFVDTIFKRKKYVSVMGGVLRIVHHRPIKISQISDVYLESGLFSQNIVVAGRDKTKIKLRAHFLKEDPQIVLERLKALT